MKKLTFGSILFILMLTVLAACGSNESSSGGSGNGSGGEETTAFNFYGSTEEWSSNEEMQNALVDSLPEYDFEFGTIDWANLEQVVKTGIAGGEPADTYVYWPNQMSSLVESGQALDLTPYLEANDGEWKSTFEEGALRAGEYDGKYYSVPLHTNFPVIYINEDIFEEAGVELPDTTWKWEEFVAAAEQIQQNTDAFPFAISGSDTGRFSWLARNPVANLADSNGELEALLNGEVGGNSEYFSTVLDEVKSIYEQDFIYPGEGALSVSTDEAAAAFRNGDAAMLADIAINAESTQEAVDFTISIAQWPAMGSSDLFTAGGPDGFFVPSNAKDPDASVEVLKTFLGEEIQTIHADHGYPVTNVNVETENENVSKMTDMAKNLETREFHTESSRLMNFFYQEFLPNYLLGEEKEVILNQLDQHIQEAYNN